MTTASAIEWRGEQVLRGIESRMAEQLDAAAEHLRQHVVNTLGSPDRDTRNASRPGDYPRSDEGTLQEHVLTDRVEPLTRHVYTDLEYGLWLEIGTRRMRPRPFLSLALREEATNITQILTTETELS
jgi:hypothetical protein